MVTEARALRVALATDAADRVEASIAVLETLKSESLVMLEAIIDRIDEEKSATVARIKALREDIEWQIKSYKKGGKLQILNFAQAEEEHDGYGYDHGHHDNGHHAKVKELIAKFEKAVEDERKAFDRFVAARRQELEEQIAIKKAAFAKVKSDHSDALNQAVHEAKERMNKLKGEKKAEMNEVVTKKLAAADAKIKDLKWNYESKVKSRLDEQQPGLDHAIKDKVVWKLKNKKHNFFAVIWDIRQELGRKLSTLKASLWRELQAESDQLWASLQSSKNRYANESQRVSRELWHATQALREELERRGDFAAEWLSTFSNDQAEILRKVLKHHKLSHGGVSVHDFAPWQIVRPVFGLLGEAKHIEDKIYDMAEELMPVYEETVRGEQVQGYRTRDDLAQRVVSENSDLIDTLGARTDDLIDTIMIDRADTENALQEVQKALIQAQVDQVRDLEARVQATKAEILDQIAELQAKLKEDHHLPYGGDARKISYYVNEKIAELKEQWQLTLQAARDEFAAIQSGSNDEWEGSLASARL